MLTEDWMMRQVDALARSIAYLVFQKDSTDYVPGGTAEDAALDELHRPPIGRRQVLPPEQAPQQDAGIQIPGAREVGGLLHRHGAADPAGGPVQAGRPHPAVGQVDAGHRHRPPPLQGKAVQPAAQGVLPRPLLIGLPQQEGHLGEIGGDEVSGFYKAVHPGAQLFRIGAVQHPVVSHDRVHEHYGIRRAEGGDELGQRIDLRSGAQKTGVDGVEGDAQLAPVR